ncbi:lipid A-modifier LpxR family protein [Chryseobacterium sp. CBSDS_008]|uniref:lipid A-modifier LpxR family protein n=1 Tax=Chryseobacterium sp. CBSDS_008 TaxID=3415265 RepID=UPI003CF88A2D
MLKITGFSQAKYEVGFQTDNDSYLGNGSDRYYTNGLLFYYRQALEVKSKEGSNLVNKIFEMEAGQKIYTPKSGYILSQEDIDRPFAGYLYIASHLNLLYNNESNLKLSLHLGGIGKDSGAERMQTLLHKKLGLYIPSYLI